MVQMRKKIFRSKVLLSLIIFSQTLSEMTRAINVKEKMFKSGMLLLKLWYKLLANCKKIGGGLRKSINKILFHIHIWFLNCKHLSSRVKSAISIFAVH